MNIYVSCTQCINESENSIEPMFKFYKVPVNEDGIYKFSCYKGHETTAISPYNKYEILFQMGANALLDGYYFEAVGCFISSVERFREWFIKFVWYLNGIEKSITDDLWKKQYKKSSERQLGAFYSMFLNHFQKAPPIFDDNQNGFRNNVLHNGVIPSQDQAFSFGKYVFNYLRLIQKTLELKYQQESFDFSSKRINENLQKFNKEHFIKGKATIQGTAEMILLQAYAVVRDTSFKDELEILKSYKKGYTAVETHYENF